jgi:predicted lipoprotein with Yx(FWY)xxD motif
MLFAGVLLAVVGWAATAGARPTARTAGVATVEVRMTNRGPILVNGATGFTLYEFTHDMKFQNSCVMISGCAEVWPALETSGAPMAGPGIRAKKLSTIMLPNGHMQVTYAGHALYGYTGDTSPGETSYIGINAFGGLWYGVNKKGKAVK